MFGSFGAGFGTFGGGVGGVLPALTNLTSWLKVPTADGTTLVNSKGVDAELTDVNCLSFDGSNDYVNTNIALTEDISFEATFKPNYTNHGKRCGTAIDGDNRLYFEFVNTSGNNIKAVIGASGNSIQIPESEAPEGVFGTIRLYPNGDVYWNGVNKGNTGGDVTGTGTNTIFIGAMNSGGVDINNQDTEYSEFKVYENGELIQHLPLAEGSGIKAYDISGNSNHGTIDDATWTTEDGIESWNHEYGFASAFANLDGADNKYLKFPLTGLDQSTFDMTMWLEGTNRSASAGKWFFNNGSQFNARGIEVKGATSFKMDFITYYSGGRVKLETPNQIVDGQMYKFDVHFESGNSYLVVDGVKGAVDTTTFTPAFTGTEDFAYIFARNNGLSAGRGIIYKLNINGEEKVLTDAELIGSPTRYNIPALNTKTKQVATFDGVADYVDTGVSDQLVKKYSVTFTPTEITNGVILGLRISRPACFELMADGSIRTGLFEGEARDNNTGANQTNTTTLVAGTKYTVEVDYDNNEIKINDVVQSTSITAGRNHTNDNVWIGGRQDSGTLQTPFKGIIHSVKLESATAVLAEYDFQNDIGTTTVQDLTTNDNDGTVTVGSGGLDSFWGQRVADNDGVLVSADYATGNTSISNPAGFVHNNSECGVKLQSRTVGTFDGAADQVNTNYQPTGDFVVDARIKLDTVTGQKVIHACGTGDGNSGYWFRISNGHWQIYAAGGYAIISTVLLQPVVDTIYDTRVEYTASSNTWVLKVKLHTDSTYTTVGSGTTSTPDFSTANVVLGQKGGIQFFNGEYYSFKLTDGGVDKVEYNFSEAQGTTTTDLSGNGNNGTITVGSGGTETFWADSYREYSANDLFSHTNGTNNTWVKESGSNITQIGQYDEDETLTSNEDTRNDRYFG